MTIPLEVPELKEMKVMLEAALRGQSVPQWYTLEQAYVVKYGSPEHGPSLLTIKRNSGLQPAGGKPDGWQQSRKAWTRETVEEWARLDDSRLEKYLEETAPGVKVPEFISASLKKRAMMNDRILAEIRR